MFLLVALSFFIARPAFAAVNAEQAIETALAKRLHERIEWIKLVHYRRGSFGGWKSEADNPLFFVASDGQTEPRSELIETLRKGFNLETLPVAMPGAPAMTVRCQYPARWKWLMKELGIAMDALPEMRCPRYEEFRQTQNSVSVTLVFSGFFVDNPSSSFGHVLLRLNRPRPESSRASVGAELLDHGVTYAANATTSNAVLYAIAGFAGYFPSTFTSIPFYYKVREYSDAESRDLWEYDLNLTHEEVERVTDHLWELGSTYFNYYYLTKNCAYHLLTLLEGAAPRLNLISRVPFYVIPIDSVKAVVSEPGLVGKITFRPSTQKQMRARFDALSSSEQAVFLQVRDLDKPAEGLRELSQDSSGRVLDTILDDIDFRFFRELVFKTDPQATARKQNVLIARAALPAGGEIRVPYKETDRPDRSHQSGRWALGVGNLASTDGGVESNPRAAIDGEVRFALHNLRDPLDGYLPYATVEFWRMQGRYTPDLNRFDLQSFALVEVGTFSPVTRLQKKPAWRFSVGADRARDRRCDGCLGAFVFLYGGGGIEPVDRVLFYAIAGPRAETSPEYRREKWLVSGAGIFGARWRMSRSWLLALESEWRRVFDRETFDRNRTQAWLRWDNVSEQGSSTSPFAVEAEYAQEPLNREFWLRLYRYF